MRTTLTLDEDVAVQLDRVRRRLQLPLRQVVNDALRTGLAALETAEPRPTFQTRTVSLGRPLLDLDDVAEALASAGGDFAQNPLDGA